MSKATRWVLLAVAGSFALSVPPAGGATDEPLGKDRKVLDPIVHGNLALFPVVVTATVKDRDYLILDVGMKKGLVKVHEKGDGVVSELTLENRSTTPLFLMAGEVILGGKQDRIIGRNTIIAAKTKRTVPVFCVEHGRWSGRKAKFESGGALAHTALRKAASFADQPEVWKEVAEKAKKRKVETATDTYRSVAKGKTVRDAIAGYHEHFAPRLAALPEKDRIVGFVVAINGKITGIELFRSPKLLGKLAPKLLRSYYVEAVDHPLDPTTSKTPSRRAISSFAHAVATGARSEVVATTKRGKTIHRKGKDGMSTSVKDAADSEEAEPVYEVMYH